MKPLTTLPPEVHALPPLFQNTLPSPDLVAQRIGQLRQTSPIFELLFQRYKEPAPALRHYGVIKWQQAELPDAIDAFRAALVLKIDDTDLWKDLAWVYDGAGDPVASEYCARSALHHDPENVQASLLLATLCRRTGRLDEAEAAFEAAIKGDPGLGDAHFGLGLLHFERKRLPAAIASLERAVAAGYANALGFAALGHARYLAGDFADAAAAFRSAQGFEPLTGNARRKYARARMIEMLIDDSIEAAIELYRQLAGEDGEDMADVLRDAFSQLSAYGHPEAAIALGRFRLSQNPEDAIQRYLLDAVSGRALARAPADYLESYFDKFAANFDSKLVDVLDYDAPALMAALIAPRRRSFANILDLGCGTGLAAEHLAAFGGQMVGVDISGGMLAEARKRGRYAGIVKADALEFLAANVDQFDLVFAADMLVYLGDLQRLFDVAAGSIHSQGYFAVSIETTAEQDYLLLPSGRFAHSLHYLERLARPHFTILAKQEATIRLEAGRPAEGLFLIMQRRP